MFDRKILIRITRISKPNDVETGDGVRFEFCINGGRKVLGRSAYLCKSKECFERCRKNGGLEYSFHMKSKRKKQNLLDYIYEDLANELEKNF